MTAALLALAAIVAAIMMFSSNRVRSMPAAPEKSIAVLPFENLSHDPDNAYFADGIQEEILTRLASVADLKIISRTSTQRYQGKPRNLREIAKELGVATILEGSVQKAADQVRVNVQLINAQTDSHLWADTYDRKLTDIFGVESEIAKRIAESLQAKLTGREEQALAVKPTNNPEAYDAYLRGLAFEARHDVSFSYSRDLLWKAAGFYERAVELDPNFALAWARLSRGHALLYFDLAATPLPLAAMRLKVLWRTRRNSSRTRLKPCLPWVIINIGCCVITGLPKPRSGALARCYQAAARSEGPSDELPDAKETGMKALPTSSKASPSIHVMWSYLRTPQRLTSASTIPGCAKALRSSAGHCTKRSGCYRGQRPVFIRHRVTCSKPLGCYQK